MRGFSLIEPVRDRLVQLLSVLLVAFHVYTAAMGTFLPLTQRAVHVGLVLAIAFLLLSPRGQKRTQGVPLYDVLLALVALAGTGYVVWKTAQFNQFPGRLVPAELILASIVLLLVLEAGRRSVGYTFIILAAVLVAYAVFAEQFPGMWRARSTPFEQVLARLYATNVGLWGEIVGISATQLASLLIFADMLLAIGGMIVLRDISIVVAGRTVGGPAKVANLASMLMGMISGSSAANAATVGAFTIPMMKGVGYPAAFAAAVEATSSTFGQLMPPVMGAGAFLIAEFVEVSYFTVTVAAYLPALIVYGSIFAAIHFYSRRRNLRGLSDEEIAAVHPQLQWYRVVPIALPVVVLAYELAIGHSADTAAIRATAAAILLHLAFTRLRSGSWNLGAPLSDVYAGVLQAARSIVMVAALVATAQIVVSLVNATSVGVKMSQFLLSVASGDIFIVLLITMAIALILGMGVPTTAAYVIAAATCAASLIELGLDPLAAHLFIFYFAVLSAITPPVCVAAYITAGIAGASWFETACHAMLMSAAKYVMPYLFVSYAALRLNAGLLEIAMYGGAVFLASVFIEAVFWNWWRVRLTLLERAMLAAATLALYSMQLPLIAAGVAVGCAAVALHYRRFQGMRDRVEAEEARPGTPELSAPAV